MRPAPEQDRGDRSSTQALITALSHSSDGVIVCDPSGIIEFVNVAALELAPAARLESGRQIFWPELEAARLRAISSGNVTTGDMTIRVPERRHLLVRAVPIETGAAVLLLVDRSESDRIDRIRRDFVANVSHELKTPVAAALALVDVMESAIEDNDHDAIRRFAERMRSDISRLSRLVTDLLDLSRVEGSGGVQLEQVSLMSLLSAAAESSRFEAETRGVTIRVEPVDLSVAGDLTQLGMAVSNLVRNAVQYSDAGEVVLSAVADGDGVRIRVADQGIGIGSDELPRIFERFYRVDRARSRATGGTGLGLAIVRHVASNHGGRVDVESELGKGSVFSIWIPSVRQGRAL